MTIEGPASDHGTGTARLLHPDRRAAGALASADALVNERGPRRIVRSRAVAGAGPPEKRCCLSAAFMRTDRLSRRVEPVGQAPRMWRGRRLRNVHRHYFRLEHARMTRTALEAFQRDGRLPRIIPPPGASAVHEHPGATAPVLCDSACRRVRPWIRRCSRLFSTALDTFDPRNTMPPSAGVSARPRRAASRHNKVRPRHDYFKLDDDPVAEPLIAPFIAQRYRLRAGAPRSRSLAGVSLEEVGFRQHARFPGRAG